MINVYANYFYEKNSTRRAELEECIIKNYNNPYINYTLINSSKKMTYKEFFDVSNSLTRDNDINIICNLDIYFDDTINLAKNIHNNEAYALSRYDLKNGNLIHFNRSDSQDAWIFKGKIRNMFCDFQHGMPGCDNRLAYEMQKAGYFVSNPSKSIKTIHIHNSNIRNYAPGSVIDTVPGPYLSIKPTHI